MIAVDTNLLVYAHRVDAPWHEDAGRALSELAEGSSPWAIPWHCIHEFIGIVTHPKIFKPPTPLNIALEAIAAWCKSPSLVLLSEGPGYFEVLRDLVQSGRIAGPQIHDARVAAVCVHHAVTELWTADRDFGRFPTLKVRNPLVGAR